MEIKMLRSLVIEFKDGTNKDLLISKATRIKSKEVGMLHFDKLSDGTWRLTFSDDITEDFSKIVSFSILREEKCQ
jgi:hypothetical protein